MSKQWVAGIDIGGTNLTVGAVQQNGYILASKTIPTPVSSGPEGILGDIQHLIQNLSAEIGSSPVAVGVGIAGQIHPKTGEVLFGPNLGWRHIPLQDFLQKMLKVPIVVTNDVRAATWGEWLHGAGRGCKDLVCVFVGTGIGGGIISGGHLLTGQSNTAGEIGHMIIELNGPSCTCGGHGCLESLASGWAIAKQADLAIQGDPAKGEAIIRFSEGPLSAKGVSLAAQAGDPLAQKILDKASEALVAGITSLVNTLNPQRLVLGGGVIYGLPKLVQQIDTAVHQRALSSAIQTFSCVLPELKQHAGVVGSASIAWNHLGELTK